MNTKKISVLEKAIQMLENGFEYNWHNESSCNCGVVSLAMGNDNTKINQATCGGLWSGQKFREICPVTGLCLSDIQRKFLENGFNYNDIKELEYLTNTRILKRSGIKKYNRYYAKKSNLITYLKAWVQILREQDSKEQPKVEVRYVTVKVDNSIFEQSKELIKN